MRILGLVIVALAIVIGVVPQYTDCMASGHMLTLPSGISMPMKCHWSARAEIALAAPLVLVGVMMSWKRRIADPGWLALMGGVLGLAVMLVPTRLIGVCASREMVCNLIMRPSLVYTGALVVLASVGYVVLSRTTTPARVTAEATPS